MRRVLLAALVAASVAAAALAAPGAEGPHRRAGLWQQQLTIDDGSTIIPPSQMCIDAAADRRLTLVGAQMDRSQCSIYHVERRADGGWALLSVCKLGAQTGVTTTASASGDFAKAYSVSAIGVTSDPTTKPVSHRVTVEAHWFGPCPPGQVGGDVTTNGATSNALAPPPPPSLPPVPAQPALPSPPPVPTLPSPQP